MAGNESQWPGQYPRDGWHADPQGPAVADDGPPTAAQEQPTAAAGPAACPRGRARGRRRRSGHGAARPTPPPVAGPARVGQPLPRRLGRRTHGYPGPPAASYTWPPAPHIPPGGYQVPPADHAPMGGYPLPAGRLPGPGPAEPRA